MWGQLAGAAPGLVLAVSTSGTAVKPCPGNSGVLCGNIKVPLYWSAPHRGSLTVHFKEYLHTDSSLPALEPIVAMEGGPGYPSTGSAASYLFMIGSLRQRHDLILMDQRGTGGSDAIKCRGVQDYDGLVRPKDFPAVVAACAKKLGAKANAFGSAAVAKDLNAVLETLQVTKVDLYGDSYGSYAAQVSPSTTRASYATSCSTPPTTSNSIRSNPKRRRPFAGPIPCQEREEETPVFFAPFIHLDFEISVTAGPKFRWLELL